MCYTGKIKSCRVVFTTFTPFRTYFFVAPQHNLQLFDVDYKRQHYKRRRARKLLQQPASLIRNKCYCPTFLTSGGDEGASKPKESLGYHSSLLSNAIYVKSTKGIFTSDQKTTRGKMGKKRRKKLWRDKR